MLLAGRECGGRLAWKDIPIHGDPEIGEGWASRVDVPHDIRFSLENLRRGERPERSDGGGLAACPTGRSRLASLLRLWEHERITGEEDRAALPDRALKQTLGQGRRHERAEVQRTGGRPEDRHVRRIAAKPRDIGADPLEQAVDQRVMRIIGVGDPEFDDLRADPRFTRLTARLCLPSAPMTGPASPIVQSRGRWK